MNSNQIKVPDNYNNADLVKTILGLIQKQTINLKNELIELSGSQARLIAEYEAKEKYKEDDCMGWNPNRRVEDNYGFKSNEQLILRYEKWLEYYEACRTYVELNLIDKIYSKENNDETNS